MCATVCLLILVYISPQELVKRQINLSLHITRCEPSLFLSIYVCVCLLSHIKSSFQWIIAWGSVLFQRVYLCAFRVNCAVSRNMCISLCILTFVLLSLYPPSCLCIVLSFFFLSLFYISFLFLLFISPSVSLCVSLSCSRYCTADNFSDNETKRDIKCMQQNTTFAKRVQSKKPWCVEFSCSNDDGDVCCEAMHSGMMDLVGKNGTHLAVYGINNEWERTKRKIVRVWVSVKVSRICWLWLFEKVCCLYDQSAYTSVILWCHILYIRYEEVHVQTAKHSEQH